VGVLGHEDVADNPEAQLGPKIIQGLNEFAPVAVGVKDAGFSVSVGGQIVEIILAVEMLQTWHGDGLYHLAEGRRHKNQCLRHPRRDERLSEPFFIPAMGRGCHPEIYQRDDSGAISLPHFSLATASDS
jgi:hypothetical protein